MKAFLLLAASAALFTFAVIDDASAQRGGGVRGGGFGGGFRGAGIGGGFRGGMVGGGFRGGMVGGGFRSAAIGPGFRGGIGPGFRGGIGPGVRGARWVGPGFVGRNVAWRGGPYIGRNIAWRGGAGFYGRRVAWAGRSYPYYRYGHRPWRYGWPIAAGFGVGLLASSAYYDSCWRYDGWQWVNVCYGPYGYYEY